jgi:hypothetical protein
VIAVLALGEMEFAGQFEQSSVPAVVLYWPARHAVNGPPFWPVYPALATQAVLAVLAAGEVEPVEHAVKVLMPAGP